MEKIILTRDIEGEVKSLEEGEITVINPAYVTTVKLVNAKYSDSWHVMICFSEPSHLKNLNKTFKTRDEALKLFNYIESCI